MTSHFSQQSCRHCSSTNLREDRQHGNVVCYGCGTIADEQLFDYTAEWRAYNDTDDVGSDKSRIGFANDTLETLGRPAGHRTHMVRLPGSHLERELRETILQVQAHAFHGLKDAHVAEALRICLEYMTKHPVRGSNRLAAIAAAIFFSYKHCTDKELAVAFNIEMSLIDTAKTGFIREIGATNRHIFEVRTTNEVHVRMVNQLPLGEEQRKRVLKRVRMMDNDARKTKPEFMTCGSELNSINAALILIALQLEGIVLKKKDVAKTYNITPHTLMNLESQLLAILQKARIAKADPIL